MTKKKRATKVASSVNKKTAPLRYRLTDRQCVLFRNDMAEFGFPLSLAEIRRIANEVADGTYDHCNVAAVILARQLDGVNELRCEAGKPRLGPRRNKDVTK